MNQHKNYQKTLTEMYGLMVGFNPTRATPVSRGRNKGLNVGNVEVESETIGAREHGSGSGIWRNLECWRCVGGKNEEGLPKTRQGKRK